uniref:Sodium-dependent lysophosphatidylcholine symporter 1-B n=1 Tax=Gadus morhua TaxID=8049 RepID=A0A8C5ADL8_GADMO
MCVCVSANLSPSLMKPPSGRNERRKPLSVCSKLCYAVGGAPYQITGSALGFFLQIYLLDVAQLDPFYASIILFVGRAWDAVTDPCVGFLVSRTKWTRFGRMMPWVLLSTPFAVTCYFLIWYVPAVEQGKVLWYLVFYCLFQSLQTCFHVPYSSFTMFISDDQKERDSATAYRKSWYTRTQTRTHNCTGLYISTLPYKKLSFYHYRDTNRASDRAYHFLTYPHHSRNCWNAQHIIWVPGNSLPLCSTPPWLCVPCVSPDISQKKAKPITFCQGLRLVMGHGPYVKLVLGFLFISLAFMLMEGNFALFLTYALDHREDFQNILLVIMLSGTISIPFWQWFLTRFGKKTAVYLGITWAVPFMILMVCIKSNLVISYMVSVATGASVAVAFLLPWSMLPDVVDDFKLKNPDIRGYEAIFFSFYVFFTKFASGVSLGISTLSLDFAGYVSRGCYQPESVILTLKVLVSPVPVALIAIGLLILKTYPIDEEKRKSNRKLLQELLDTEDSESETTALGSVV